MTLEPKRHPNDGSEQQPEIVLARWGTRFWAWVVDFIIVTTAVEIIFSIAYAPLAFNQGITQNPTLNTIRYAVESLIFFGYWTYFESTGTGQSIGKRLLKIKTTDMTGNHLADVKSVAIQSFGKAFLLPLDVLLGWIFTNDLRQRLLSRAASTIVVKVQEEENNNATSGNIRYRKE